MAYLNGMTQPLPRVTGLDQGMILWYALIMVGGELGR